MKEGYEHLIANFCNQVGLAEVEQIIGGNLFAIDEVEIRFGYDKRKPGAMLVYTDFGPMPAQRKQAIYYTLLEQNFIRAVGSNASFCMTPVTRHVTYIEQLRLDTMTPEKLVEKTAWLADRANEWRVTHFIGDTPPAPPAPRGSAAFLFNAER